MNTGRAWILSLFVAIALQPATAVQAGGPGHCYDPSDRAGWVCPPCGCAGDRVAAKKAGPCEGCGMNLVEKKRLTHVAILLYDGVELLDFSGPAGVFSAAGYYVYTVSPNGRPVRSAVAAVDAEYRIETCPWPDVLVVPGGRTEALTGNQAALGWIKTVSAEADVVMSVCSGAFVLARMGALDGLEATTHSDDVKQLERAAPRTRVHTGARFVDNGRIVTTAGVSSGIDGALHVVHRLSGEETARRAAKFIEYERWDPGAGIVVSGR